MLKNILTICIIFFTTSLIAQKLNRVQGEVLVQLHPKIETIQPLLKQYQAFKGRNTQIKAKKCVSEVMNIWQLKFDFSTIHEAKFLHTLRHDKAVLNAQFNRLVTMRKTPNDADFLMQWQYINDGSLGGNVEADLDADLAWDITTGGVTANGDTIVVAALDDGVDLSHEDLQENLWVNTAEIPDNGIDDDGNGYIDDIYGWNVKDDTPNIGFGGSHGTPVMGIMGAKGNNGIGVTGISWDVKVMMIKTDFLSDEATILAGYGYPLTMRKMYNETNGEKGAFVVATNASWGVDGGKPEDAPIWCALYDSLGLEGILSVGATVNENFNVDIEGDLPTTCPSNYFIGVTNLNRSGEKEIFAGYGKANIDLGAFGENTFTIGQNNRYENFGGTSAAAPHVTGAIGLMYAVPCKAFSDLAKNKPTAAASLVRQYILEGVKPNAFLDTITVTGGQLNLHNSLQLLMQICGTCPQPIAVTTSNVLDTALVIEWENATENTQTTLRYRIAGTEDWTVIANIESPYQLRNVAACTNYEFQLKNDCGEETSDYSRTYTFKTDGCCTTPENVRLAHSTSQSFRFEWNALLAADRYEVNFTHLGASNVQIFSTTDNFIEFNDLQSCTAYEMQVRTICKNGTVTAFSPLLFVTTNGCGACRDLTYCTSTATLEDEWISKIVFNDIENESGSEFGYGDYTGISTDVNILGTYDLTVDIGYSNLPYKENIQAWIDYNHDGVFDDETEKIVSLLEDIENTYTTAITIPADAVPGLTRMRVTLKWREGGDTAIPKPCDVFDFGEVEDYCINILSSDGLCLTPDDIALVDDPIDNIAILGWSNAIGALSYAYQYRIQGTETWTTGTIDDPKAVFLTNLQRCATYEFQVQSVCDSMQTSDLSETFFFNTQCDCIAPTVIQQVDTQLTSIQLTWEAIGEAEKYEVSLTKIGETGATRIIINENQVNMTSLDKCSEYEARVRGFCLETNGAFSDPVSVFTACGVAVTSLPTNIEKLSIFPNPFGQELTIELNFLEKTTLRLQLYDVSGKRLMTNDLGEINTGEFRTNLNTASLQNGVYLLGIETDKGRTVRRVIKL